VSLIESIKGERTHFDKILDASSTVLLLWLDHNICWVRIVPDRNASMAVVKVLHAPKSP